MDYKTNEIKLSNDIFKDIGNNMEYITYISNEIIKFINDIKLINNNYSIYDHDIDNNYKYISIESLEIINYKLNIEKK